MGKAKYKITNWKKYNQALVNRGSLTFWVNVTAIKAWHCLKHNGHRGCRLIFSETEIEIEIEIALMVKGIFKLPLRGLEGFLNSVFTLINVLPNSPTYTCISKRLKTVKIM